MTAGRIAVVLGTRPEIIKLAPIITKLGDDAEVVFTGQHYDPELVDAIAGAFGLALSGAGLGIGGRSRGEQIGQATAALDAVFAASSPAAVVVQGDTNTTLAAGLAANAREIPLVHIEAGLRSRDRAMPEEHNRILVDHLADLCCTPTDTSAANLAAEGIAGSRVTITGNTVVEAVTAMLPDAEGRDGVLAAHRVEPGRFVVATFHRPENVDDPGQLGTWLRSLARIPLPVILPLHPRTRARVASAGFEGLLEPLAITEPMPYAELLSLAAESALIVSDSGGLQEEASVFKRPIAVVRRSTERPEVLGTFAALVQPGSELDEQIDVWLADLDGVHARLRDVPCPYGDGTAAARSIEAIRALLAG